LAHNRVVAVAVVVVVEVEVAKTAPTYGVETLK